MRRPPREKGEVEARDLWMIKPDLAASLLPLTVPEVRRLVYSLVWQRPLSAQHGLHWSQWRRRHQARARRCHYRRRLHLLHHNLRL